MISYSIIQIKVPEIIEEVKEVESDSVKQMVSRVHPFVDMPINTEFEVPSWIKQLLYKSHHINEVEKVIFHINS
jgi:hypothetical protein